MRASFFIPLFAAATAFAHGFVAEVIIDGVSYKGNVPQGPKNPSIIRQISTTEPVKGANNPAVNCGPNASPASLVANANPGSVIDFDWKAGVGFNWPHNIGPMMTYLASCGNRPCNEFDSTNADWFKIEEALRKPGSDTWYQDDLMKGGLARVTLPANLAPGGYIIRHEILALHLGPERGGAEFYPGCAQILVGGNGNGRPTANELVRLPGAYSDDSPSIFTPNIFNGQAPYSTPGPAIAALVGGPAPPPPNGNSGNSGSGNSGNGGSSSSSNNSGYGSSSTSVPAPSSTSAPANGGDQNNGGGCYLKKKKTNSKGANVARSTHHPRRISRVMREIILGQGSLQ